MLGLKECSPIPGFYPVGKWEAVSLAPHDNYGSVGSVPGYSSPYMDISYELYVLQIYKCTCKCPSQNTRKVRVRVFRTTKIVSSNDRYHDFIWTSISIKPWSPLPIPNLNQLNPSLTGEIIASQGEGLYPQFPVDTSDYINKIINVNRPSRNSQEGEIKYDSGVPSIFCFF